MGIVNSCNDMSLGLFVPVLLLVSTRSLDLPAPGAMLQTYAEPWTHSAILLTPPRAISNSEKELSRSWFVRWISATDGWC